jgi:hypothetical protein
MINKEAVTMADLKFAPKGGMCANCVNSLRLCDHLPFDQMKVVGRCKVSLIKIVACTEYAKTINKHGDSK